MQVISHKTVSHWHHRSVKKQKQTKIIIIIIILIQCLLLESSTSKRLNFWNPAQAKSSINTSPLPKSHWWATVWLSRHHLMTSIRIWRLFHTASHEKKQTNLCKHLKMSAAVIQSWSWELRDLLASIINNQSGCLIGSGRSLDAHPKLTNAAHKCVAAQLILTLK